MRGAASGFVERVGVLTDGECSVTMSTMAGKDQVVCVAPEHTHCAGCYRAMVGKPRVWCSTSCSKMVDQYYAENREEEKAIRKVWALKRRRYRTNKAVKAGVAAFLKVYGVAPTKLYVDTRTMPWLGGVKMFFPGLRLVRLPGGVQTEGHAILFGVDEGRRVCLAICRLSLGAKKKGEGG